MRYIHISQSISLSAFCDTPTTCVETWGNNGYANNMLTLWKWTNSQKYMRTKNTTESEKSCIRESMLERKWQLLQLDLLLKLQFSLQLPSFVWPTYSASTKYFSNQSCHYQCSFKMKPNKQFLITLFNGSHFSLSLHNLTLLEELRILRHTYTCRNEL